MLFNSPQFLFVFLPLVLGGYFLIAAKNRTAAAVAFLALASLVFYAYWKPIYLVLILASVLGNFGISRWLTRTEPDRARRWILILGVVFNLGLLGYFKYAAFVVTNAALALGQSWSVGHIMLPLAISFFTFQQIAYLVDCWRGNTTPPTLARYLLFVAFFPQLIAGPIVHHYELLPQFDALATRRPRLAPLVAGLTIFFAGLFKKVVLADSIGAHADTVFDAVAAGAAVGGFDAWIGAFAFGFQIYFDFSAYSDMAIGLALMFGIRLPLNFNSPYKAASIIDFWRRWHMTLSRFLREHLYVPLGGNRHGRAKQMRNILIVMVLGGLWHGAGWGFVLWGGLHGIYLVLNHAWRTFGIPVPLAVGRLATLIAVMFAWVPFRAETWDRTATMWAAMLGGGEATARLTNPMLAAAVMMGALAIVWILPNTQDWTGFSRKEAVARLASWRPTRTWAVVNAGIAMVGIAMILTRSETQEFLYFQF
ncbi:MAG: MBOAT family protein [Alphaproteobacteria bacterium]|jgi:alginate O-acetyltransferase complex protein AlgI|nr:MBOAT family protein [Alphaproteobacteria bacterium]MBT5861246.1 MBOAT family protein [Alphaproteobacteria bacterium]